MSMIPKMLFYLRSLFWRRKLDAQMSEEMKLHLEMETESKVAAGMSPEEARYAAQREFGNVASIQERTRDEHGWVRLEHLWKDVRLSFRSLNRNRGFAAAVWSSLVVGIGLATAVFDLTQGIIFAPKYPEPGQLYLIGYEDNENPFSQYRTGMHLHAYQEQVNDFSEYAAVSPKATNIIVGGEPVVDGLFSISRDGFQMLGVTPAIGRGFLPEEFLEGKDNVVMISDFFWRRRFDASPEILGRKVLIDQRTCVVIGVLRRDQVLPLGFDGNVYRPLVFKVDPNEPFDPGLTIIGRLRRGISPEQARKDLDAVKLPTLPNWAQVYFGAQRTVLSKQYQVDRPETLWVMLIAAALLYVMAFLNSMNLVLVRLLGRRHELGIRLALGGTRWQTLRLLVMEGVVLTLLAGMTVVCAARWLFPVLFQALTENEKTRYAFFGDARTLCCIGGLTTLTVIFAVLAPLWHLYGRKADGGLKEGGRTATETRSTSRLRNVLVMLQAALAVLLLAGTGLMMRSFEKLSRVDLGFDPIGRVTVQVDFPRGLAPEPKVRMQYFERLREKLSLLPGVREVSAGQETLLTGYFGGTAQLQMTDGSYRPTAGSYVTENFLHTAGLTMVRGQWLSDNGKYEVVINETLARERFGDENPIGKHIKLLVNGDYPIPVVGVVHDVRENLRSKAGMRIYVPAVGYPPNTRALLLRMDQDPREEFASLVRHTIYEFDPKVIAYSVSSMNAVVGNSMWNERYAYKILKWLSAIALGMSGVGLFSVMAFAVNARTKEFGVRTALGARPADLYQLVMTRGVLTVLGGVGLGLAGAMILTRFMQSLLFEISPNDPLVYLGVSAMLVVSALLACWLPARRAAKVDPVIALRAE